MEKKIASTLLEKDIKVSITETRKRIFRQSVEVIHEFVLKPPTLGILIAIGKEIQDIKSKDLDAKMNLTEVVQWVHYITGISGESLVNILSIILTNNNPNAKIKRLIKDSVTPKELQDIFSVYLTTINVSDFISSIVLIKQSDIIKTSPLDQRS